MRPLPSTPSPHLIGIESESGTSQGDPLNCVVFFHIGTPLTIPSYEILSNSNLMSDWKFQTQPPPRGHSSSFPTDAHKEEGSPDSIGTHDFFTYLVHFSKGLLNLFNISCSILYSLSNVASQDTFSLSLLI